MVSALGVFQCCCWNAVQRRGEGWHLPRWHPNPAACDPCCRSSQSTIFQPIGFLEAIKKSDFLVSVSVKAACR